MITRSIMPEDANLAELSADSGSSSVSDTWGFLNRRKWIVILALVVGVAAGVLHFAKVPRVYSSSAQLLVVNRDPRLNTQTSQERLGEESLLSDDVLQTQTMIIRSDEVLSGAIKEARLANLPSLADQPDPLRAVKRSLSVSRGSTEGGARDAGVLTITYQGTHAEDCAKIVEAVIKSYQGFLGSTYEDVSQETASLIRTAQNDLKDQLDAKEQEYRDVLAQAPVILTGDQGQQTDVHSATLADLVKARSEIEIRRAELEARLEAINKAKNQTERREALLLMLKRSAEGLDGEKEDTDSIDYKLMEVLLEEQMVESRVGKDHPDHREMKKKTGILRDMLNGYTGRDGAHGPIDVLTLYHGSLQEELSELQEREKYLKSRFAEEEAEVKDITQHQMQKVLLERNLENLRSMYNAVAERLREIELVKEYGGQRTRVITPATAGVRVSPTLGRSLGISGLIAGLIGVVLAFLVDLADRNFRSPADIRSYLGVPVLAHIPFHPTAMRGKKRFGRSGSPISDSVITHHQPGSMGTEAYRTTRTALLCVSFKDGGGGVVQVTSPLPGAGKSTVSANLAVAMAQSGKSVLLIDGDLRRPSQHRLFGADLNAGVASVLRGEDEFAMAVQTTDVDNLWIMTAGPSSISATELLASPALDAILAKAREQYDCVIVDSPPVLAVSDALTIASRVDRVMLIVRLTSDAKPLARNAVETLQIHGAKLVGVVVNGVSSKSSKRYKYGYGGKYAYSYGYGSQGYHPNGDAQAAPVARRRAIAAQDVSAS